MSDEAGSQVYLLLFREGAFNYNAPLSAWNVATLLPSALLKDMVWGDSLDVPFMKWIRVEDLQHEIGYHKKDKGGFVHPGGAYADRDVYGLATGLDEALNIVGSLLPSAVCVTDYASNTGHPISLPPHGELEFSCFPGKQTPQLSFGCMAQEKFPLAIFCFRRRIGPGLGGIRNPQFVIGLKDCMVRDWSIGGNLMESAKLSYNKIAWGAIDVVADTNLPAGFSLRWFNKSNSEGGEGGFALIVEAVVQAISLTAGGIIKAMQ